MSNSRFNTMILELAPMEGITTYTYRNALNKYYGGIDVYFSPFISTHKEKKLNYKELNDILPENNVGLKLIPQVLTNDVDEFIYTAGQIKELSYDTINLNFGCPSGTVTAKNKGAGFLAYPEKLEKFLDEVFEKTDFKISVKTRLGYSEYEEWKRLLKIYLKFPLEELIIHGRVREDFYNGKSRVDIVRDSLAGSGSDIRISYNGDIYTREDCQHISDEIEGLYGCMLGRGIITNPGLANSIKNASEKALKGNNKNASDEDKYTIDTDVFKAFNLELMHNYKTIMGSDRNALFKLKELWVYMSRMFPDSEKVLKKIQKCKSISEYEVYIKSIIK